MDGIKTTLRRLRADYRLVTGPLRGLPSALIIDAPRSGSTALLNYVTEHPDVLPPFGKEVHYFDFHYAKGVKWYRGRFPYTHQLEGMAVPLRKHRQRAARGGPAPAGR